MWISLLASKWWCHWSHQTWISMSFQPNWEASSVAHSITVNTHLCSVDMQRKHSVLNSLDFDYIWKYFRPQRKNIHQKYIESVSRREHNSFSSLMVFIHSAVRCFKLSKWMVSSWMILAVVIRFSRFDNNLLTIFKNSVQP